MMTMVNLKRSNHSSLQNNLNSKSWDQHYYDRDREEDELLLPGMVESPSGSQETMSSGASNSPPPMYSSSSRMQERFSATLSKARNQRRRSRAQLEPSNSSILKGADIIKQQLSKEDSPLRATHLSKEAPNSHRVSPSSSSSELQHWDPWKIHSELSKNPTAKIEDLDLFKHEKKPNRNTRKQEILSGGDDYFQVKRDGRSKSNSRNNNNNNNNNNNATRIRNDTIVQRVSDFDDSTFESSASGGNGNYLPTQLLTCGGLNNAITDCSAPQQFLPAHLLQNNRCTTKSDEELETDTLDFLANLHSNEEDLNFAFDPFGTRSNSNKEKNATTSQEVSSSSFVTAASTPFETMLSSRSTLFDRLAQDPAYQHALKAGTVWQSLCSQHVRFPAHWWDSKQPIGPPLGSSQKRPWKYVGRHRVQGDPKLHKLIGNRSSSGRVLLHLQVRDEMTGQIAEDICCGCYHPNARGIRTTQNFDPRMEDCRDVWIAHRRRATDFNTATNNDFSYMTTLESLLIHQNKGRVHQSPLGAQGGKHVINNQNLRMVFGSKPPIYTVVCCESELYELFQEKLDGSIPASVALLRHYLQFPMRN